MTRATLLHVLDRPTALGPAEVRELEQLAQAFPYCQTAHLLLAKAAHDQGTMLAGQRLRRAATYAADRTLLRRLIEQVEPATVAVEATVVAYYDTETPITPAPATAPEIPALPEPEAISSASVAIPEPEAQQAALPAAAPVETPAAFAAPVTVVVEPLPESVAATQEPLNSTPTVAETEPAPLAVAAPEATAEVADPVNVPVEEIDAVATTENEPLAAEIPPMLIDREDIIIESTAAIDAPVPETAAETEEILPAQAPAIRPPVEVGEARFEFGLAEPLPPALPTYELPGLVDEWAASAVTRSLGTPEALAPATSVAAPALGIFTASAFTGSGEVGYAFGESSRLGLALQLLNLLTDKAELAATQAAAAQPPATALPPTGTFFEPDPLLCEHWATHCPPVVALPSTVDLINNFLRRQPRLTRPAMLPPAASHQADLSVRSTRAEPDLVSENLARIFVRQGKTARAIEIYEKLIVKQPEKLAYFTAQIHQLQPSA